MNKTKIRTFTLSFALMLLALGTVGCGGGGGSMSSAVVSPAPNVVANVTNPNHALVPAQIALAGYLNEPGVSSTFIWSVTSSRKPSISHWVVGFKPDCPVPVILSSSDPATVWILNDPTTGVRGIKFDTGYDDLENRTVTLTLQGDWSVGVVDIAIKAGQEVSRLQIDGPVCGAALPPETYDISGIFFFDANGDGLRGADEPGIPGQVVSLSNGSSVTTGANGGYLFTVPPGNYTISFPDVPGFLFSTASFVPVTVVAADIADVDGGVVIDFGWIRTRSADGYTIGYWKTNLEKAIRGTTKGVQVPAATLTSYLASIFTFALEPLNVSTWQAAVDILSSTSSAPASLLAKQLMGSEFNLMSGAWIGGNRLVTEMFVYQGEYLLKNAATVPAETLLLAKDRFDAYNNSHGGLVLLP